jgi:hypothetical protein
MALRSTFLFTEKISQQESNAPLQSGILQKQRELCDGRELLRICRERVAPPWVKSASKLREKNAAL